MKQANKEQEFKKKMGLEAVKKMTCGPVKETR